MNSILYYSNYCNNCKQLLQNISKNNEFKNSTHFICVDNRVKRGNDIFIILSNQKEIQMPENIKCVPSLQLLNRGNQCLTGNQILKWKANYSNEVAMKDAWRWQQYLSENKKS